MSDLIDRQAAIDAVYKCADIFAGDMPVMVVKADAYEALAQLPSAEPEIVRCKDCKHYKEWESEFTPNAVVTQCMADNFPIRKAIPDGWFCAGAERKRK